MTSFKELARERQESHNPSPVKTRRSSEKVLHGIGFAELVSYIETYRGSLESRPIFKMADMKNLYITRLNELGFGPSPSSYN